MDEALRAVLYENAESVCRKLAESGSFALSDAADRLISRLGDSDAETWKNIQENFVRQGSIDYLKKVIAQLKAIDPAQTSLEGLESMPLLIASEEEAILSDELDYDHYRTEEKRLERQIRSYDYPRRKPENLEEDRKRLTEMRAFSPKFAKYSKENPDLKLAEAKKIEAEESPKKRKRKKKKKR